MSGGAGGLGRGASDVGRGFRFVGAHPGLWGWLIAPALVSLLVIGAIAWGAVALASPLLGWATGWLPDAIAGFGRGLLGFLLGLGLVALGLLVFVSIVGLVAGPFNELLSEAVEDRLLGVDRRFGLGEFLRGAALGIAHAVRRLFTAGFAAGAVFGMALVPGVGTLAAIALGFYVAARAAAYDCYDAVLARRMLSYEEKGEYLARHRRRSVGLGAAVTAMLLVPGLNLVALGIGAVGATLAIHEIEGTAGRSA